MILYPAIDLKDGACVRLHKGEMDTATVYNPDPAAQAAAFAADGFAWLHVVDLNGAVEGRPVNEGAVRAIMGATPCPVQLGGGIRTLEGVERWIKAGVARVILGTAAIRTPELVFDAGRAFPGQIALGLDARGLDAAVDGWTAASGVSVLDLLKRFEDAGVAAVIYTDISRDGTGEGLNMDNTILLAGATRIPVIASGGVGSLEDLRAVKAAADKGVQGVIIGRALYDGRISATEALALAGPQKA